MRICRASHIWQLPINKSMAGSAGSRSSSIWKYMMMVLHPVIFYNGARARTGLMLASTHNWNSAGIRGSREVCSAGGHHRVPTQASYGRGVQRGRGFKCTETWRPRFVFFSFIRVHQVGFLKASVTLMTKTSRTGQITWIRSLEMGNYSHEFIVVMSNFLLPWWQVRRYQTKMHLLKLAILVPTPSSWLFLPQQTFQWGRAEDNRRKKESGWGLVRPLEALVIPTHIPCILHAQSSGGTKNRNLTLFKYRIWGIKARLILE